MGDRDGPRAVLLHQVGLLRHDRGALCVGHQVLLVRCRRRGRSLNPHKDKIDSPSGVVHSPFKLRIPEEVLLLRSDMHLALHRQVRHVATAAPMRGAWLGQPELTLDGGPTHGTGLGACPGDAWIGHGDPLHRPPEILGCPADLAIQGVEATQLHVLVSCSHSIDRSVIANRDLQVAVRSGLQQNGVALRAELSIVHLVVEIQELRPRVVAGAKDSDAVNTVVPF
mmetsp:Transcript_40579/g.91376  ORF Transcript_40579/g.91376 Transcript_40579/m.91376 type:complete len:225 (+) Transcript_40579:1012-1686(+)